MKNPNHHVIPISIGGWDIPENIIIVSKEDHILIHKILNIPYDYIREFRKQTNHKFYIDKEYVVQLRKLHCRYFENINKLSEVIYNQHVHSLQLQIEKLEADYQLIRNDKPLQQSTIFETRLYQYHDLLYKISTIKGKYQKTQK